MKYEKFEDLPVWQAAADLSAKMFPWTTQDVFKGMGDLANQLQRAALSISNNIAEGFERGTTSELIAFLYYSRGSAGEVRSMLCVMERMNSFDHLKSEILEFKSTCESISRQIRGWTNSLQNSSIEGQRYLNDQSRNKFENKKRAAAFADQRRKWQIELEERLKQQASSRRESE